MLTVAFCHDSAKARTERQRWFDPHVQHLRRVMSRIQLAAPLATADGATISNGDILQASVFALESPDFPSARELMHADPYMQQGVWESIDFFDVIDSYGSWAAAPGPIPPLQRLYAVFCAPAVGVAVSSTDKNFTAHRSYYIDRTPPAMFGARLLPRAADTHSPPAARWNSVSFLCADSLHHAQSVAALDPNVADRSWQARVWAIPLAVGSWTGITDL
jgi:uncharacterized protein YciI